MSGKPLKMKDLIDVKFTLVNDVDDKRSLIVKDDERYMCAVTKDLLNNSVIIHHRTIMRHIMYSVHTVQKYNQKQC